MGCSGAKRAHYGQFWVVAGLVAGLKVFIMDSSGLCSGLKELIMDRYGL